MMAESNFLFLRIFIFVVNPAGISRSKDKTLLLVHGSRLTFLSNVELNLQDSRCKVDFSFERRAKPSGFTMRGGKR